MTDHTSSAPPNAREVLARLDAALVLLEAPENFDPITAKAGAAELIRAARRFVEPD